MAAGSLRVGRLVGAAVAFAVMLGPSIGPAAATSAPLGRAAGVEQAPTRAPQTAPSATTEARRDPLLIAPDPPAVGDELNQWLAGQASADTTATAHYRLTPYTIRTLAPDALPYASTHMPSKNPPDPHDADGVPMKLVDGKLYYSPAGLMQYAIGIEDAYRRTHDADYLAIATKILDKMLALGVRSGDGVYLPYRFDFAMHKISTEVMHAPWYSAMAQGLALSLAVRLHRDTGDARFMSAAGELFTSLAHVGRGTLPWVTYIDPSHYLWLEEYPEPTTPSDHAANGFNFALFGLYDYYEETHGAKALQVLRAGLTTMRHYVSQYRNPGTYSDYCLRHGKPQAKYHEIVTWQLVFLYKMSGDSYFLSMSRLFAKDYS